MCEVLKGGNEQFQPDLNQLQQLNIKLLRKRKKGAAR